MIVYRSFFRVGALLGFVYAVGKGAELAIWD